MKGSQGNLPDIQAQLDVRGIPIGAVGVKGVRYPIVVRSGGRDQATVATVAMTVGLSAESKGTHVPLHRGARRADVGSR